MTRSTLFCFALALLASHLRPVQGAWDVGVGIGDVTGPAGGIGMMGYAKPGQNTAGIHLRQHARAFVFDDGVHDRGVFVSVDIGMMGDLVKERVIQALQLVHGNTYRHDNVILSGTHTHSGPAGFLQYVLYDVSCLGFVEETFNAIVDGIVLSIQRAHDNMQPAYLYYAEGELHDANINRSPTSYLVNPQEERDRYQYDTDHRFPQLNIYSRETNQPIGLINWFAVHPVSMDNLNKLISSDNKGVAALIVEKQFNSGGFMGQWPGFVAAFASTNLGDVSPNLNGTTCSDTGLPCDAEHSTCDGRVQMCHGRGPGRDIFESTWMIGERQANKALELLTDRSQQLLGELQFIHQFINMSNYQVQYEDGSQASTCPPALGYSFAAGTTDGPGAFNFIQGSNKTNIFWEQVVDFLKEPSPEQVACHAPKPILLDTGEVTLPYLWHPQVVATQALKIGDLIIGTVPGELTTMAGRRMRDTIFDTAVANGASPESKVVMAGLSNAYTHYITTFQEYQRQRYEAASTLYGPHTLRAYQNQFQYLIANMLQGTSIPPGPNPPDQSEDQWSLVPNVPVDVAPNGTSFGQVVQQPPSQVQRGDTVVVRFVTGNPRSDVRLGDTFMHVLRMPDNVAIFNDADWETRYYWLEGENKGESFAEFHWHVPETQEIGSYAIRHYGNRKLDTGDIVAFEGTSAVFSVQ